MELSSFILKELKKRIEASLKAQVEKAVITVPAYFNDAQRQATRDAGKLSGLDVLRIINEPTAASLAYGIGLDPDEQQIVAVYDLGGGTFDISILKLHQGIFEVLSTNGNTLLGGDDFDQAIIAHWKNALTTLNERVNADPKFAQTIRRKAIEAKKTLSLESSYSSTIEHYELTLTQSTFERLIQIKIDETITACQRAVQDSKVDLDQIDKVILVGGSTRIPSVRNAVGSYFQKEPYDQLNPEEVVALGAAIQGDILAGKRKDILLLDVTPLSLGIETMGGLMDVIIPRNSKVPSSAGRQYTTSVDGQKNLKVAVYQGERDLVANNRKLGEFILKNIPPYPAGIPKIEIHFILNADGILKVKAKELRSNTETEIEIRSQYGISEEEMAKMLLDSIQHAEEDVKVKALLESRNEADSMIRGSEKFIQNNSDLLDPTALDQFKEHIAKLKSVSQTEDKDGIQLAMHELNVFSEPYAQKAMEKALKGAMEGKKIDNS